MRKDWLIFNAHLQKVVVSKINIPLKLPINKNMNNYCSDKMNSINEENLKLYIKFNTISKIFVIYELRVLCVFNQTFHE